MSTGDKKSNIYLKKFLPQQQMTENFLEYLAKRDEENLKLQYPTQGYFFGNSMAGSAADEIQAATPSLATDGAGHLLKLDPADAKAKFENALGEVYHVAMRYNVREKDTELNVRTGAIEYTFMEDAIGEKGEPDAVIDNGSTLRLEVDGLFEAGVSHAGRQAIVYMKRAVGQADAFFVGLTTFVSGKNVIDTTHLIGQTAGLVSTDPTDYWVFIPGLTIRKTDMRSDPNYVYLGTVTGGGAGTTPLSGQIDNSEAIVLYDGGTQTTLVNTMRAFLVGGGLVTWELATKTLTWSADIRLKIASLPYDYQVVASNITDIDDGECGYIELDGVGGIKTITLAALADVPDPAKFQPLFIRYGNNIHFWQGALELLGDAATPTTGRIDGVTEDLLSYIGATNESDADPDYKNATGVAKENIHLQDGDSLTRSIKKLELRNDVVVKVKAIDLLSTTLPTGANPSIDGQVIADGQLVLFANSLLNKICKATNVATSVVWVDMPVFGGQVTPSSMSLVGVQDSASEFIRNLWQWTSAIGWKPFNLSEVMSEPTGFPNRDDSEMSFDDGTRTFSIQPKSPATSFYYFQKGRVFRNNAAKTVVIPDAEGLHYIYFDGVNLVSTQTFSDDLLKTYTFVSTVYWDAANNVSVLFSEERHSLTMDGKTHEYLHNTVGMQWVSGLGLSNTPGNGSANSDSQVAVGDGILYDEDIAIAPKDDPAPSDPFEQILDPIAELPILYRQGVSGAWRKFAATAYPAHLGAARLQFNNPAGPWTLEDAGVNGNFIAMWIFATNDLRHPVISIMGQRQDTTLNDAKANNLYEAMDFGDLPSLEMKALYRVIFQTSAAFANTNKSFVADVVDLRKSEDTSLGSYQPTAHNNLAGRNAPNAHPATSISTVTTNFKGALSAQDQEVQQALLSLDDHFKALRLHEHPSNKQRVVLTGASVTLNTGTVLEQQIRNLIMKFDGLQIDFQTGIIYEADGVTVYNGGLNNFTPVIPPLGENRWASLTLLPSTVNADNSINVQPLVLISDANDFRAVFASGTKVGQVKLQHDSGAIDDILQASITQQGVGGGGGGDGTGDANSFLEDLKARLRNTQYWTRVTPNIFSRSEDDLVDNASTGAYDIANTEFDLDVIGQTMLSIQQYGARFLANDSDSVGVELEVLWNTVDEVATYEASRDGGLNWSPITMERVQFSSKYRGSVQFPEPTNVISLAAYLAANADGQRALNLTTDQEQAISIVVPSGEKWRGAKVQAFVNKLGAPLGNVWGRIVADNAGAPGSTVIADTQLVSIAGLGAGNQNLDFTFTSILPAGTYWFILKTDGTYKGSYSAGVNELRWRTDGSAPTYAGGFSRYDGTTWTAIAGTDACFDFTGIKFDLRVRITAGTNDVALNGYGIFYQEKAAITIIGTDKPQRFIFSGDIDKYEFDIGNFLPNPLRCMAFVNGRETYRYGMGGFTLQGQKVIFTPGTFLEPGTTFDILFLNNGGGQTDNSDENAALMAANHLGSTDATIDRSSPGRGVVLRRPDGTLRELSIDDFDNIVISSVP